MLLAACSAFGGGTSSVMQIGKDSYNVRAMSERSVSDAKQKALTAANGACKSNGNRNVMLVHEFSGTESETGEKFYDLTFMCLAQGDADFTRVKRQDFETPSKPAE